VQETFELTNAKSMFDFVFRLYNIVSLANEDNRTLRDPVRIVGELQMEVSNMELPALTSLKRNGGRSGHADNDILSDVAILEALKGASYTIPPEVEGFKSLLPVPVSFP
jgi:hypothetical protein